MTLTHSTDEVLDHALQLVLPTRPRARLSIGKSRVRTEPTHKRIQSTSTCAGLAACEDLSGPARWIASGSKRIAKDCKIYCTIMQ